MRRVVVTGMGMVTPLASGVEPSWSKLLAGESGIRPIEGDTVGQIVMSLMSTGIAPLDRLVPGIPEPVARLTARMLSRERALRPGNLREPFLTLSNTTSPDFSFHSARKMFHGRG